MSRVEYEGEVTKLPEKFADEVLDLEIKVENDDCDLSTIQRLNELYRIAIEYYIGVDIKKSTHFQKKLTHLLTSPVTLRLIDSRHAKTMQKTASHAKLHQQGAINLNNQLERFKSQPKQYVKTILENNEKRLQQTENIIREGIMKQQSKVMERVRSRKAL